MVIWARRPKSARPGRPVARPSAVGLAASRESLTTLMSDTETTDFIAAFEVTVILQNSKWWRRQWFGCVGKSNRICKEKTSNFEKNSRVNNATRVYVHMLDKNLTPSFPEVWFVWIPWPPERKVVTASTMPPTPIVIRLAIYLKVCLYILCCL